MIDISSILGVNLRKYGKAHNRLIFFTKKTNNLSKYILIVLSLVNNKCNILIAIRTAIPKPTTLSAIKTAVRQKLFNTCIWGIHSQKHSILGILSAIFSYDLKKKISNSNQMSHFHAIVITKMLQKLVKVY